MRRLLKIIYLFFGIPIAFCQNDIYKEPIKREFIQAGKIDAIIGNNPTELVFLILLDLKNDSLYNLVNDILITNLFA